MKHMGIEVDVLNRPELDTGFIPLIKFNDAFLAGAAEPFGVALTRNGGQVAAAHTFIHGGADMLAADTYYIDRLVKTLLWMKGGYELALTGSEAVCKAIARAYERGGSREFDSAFMSRVYERPFTVRRAEELPEERSEAKSVGRHLDGCRIGFDAGGSDRKVSAVTDGECVFSEEVVWHPKTQADPQYHYDGIVSAMKSAAAHLPRVDAIGVSSAGVFVDNRTMVASLFLSVPDDVFDSKVKDIYLRAAAEIADVPVEVCNDGDVTALAGAMSMDVGSVLGIAMGTSEAAGFVDADGNITGWLNELAFAPVDANPEAMRDEWSGDIGCGVKYFSQDGVIKLAGMAGIELAEATPAEKLKAVQAAAAEGDGRALRVYGDIGVYLGHTLALYERLYGCKYALLLGRVMSGVGGDIIIERARRVLQSEYPGTAARLAVSLPDEKSRRVGQSVAAASLAERKRV